jgi:hypothetical protein
MRTVVGGVDMLSACAGSAIGVDTQVGFIDVDVDIFVDLGITQTEGNRMSPRRAVVGADPDQAVDAPSTFKFTIAFRP